MQAFLQAGPSLVRARARIVVGLVVVMSGIGVGEAARAAGLDEAGLPPGRPVRSNAETASAGRSPLAVRIAMAEKIKAAPPVDPPSAAEVNARSTEPGADGETSGPDRQKLLGRVKEKLAGIAEPTRDAVRPDSPGTEAETTESARPGIPRLVIDCEESAVEARGGEVITWRVTVRNTGADAHGVAVTVFFAEGIEPVAVSGTNASVAPGEVRVAGIEHVPSGGRFEFVVTGEAKDPGAVAYRVEAACREVPGAVAREAIVLIRPR